LLPPGFRLPKYREEALRDLAVGDPPRAVVAWLYPKLPPLDPAILARVRRKAVRPGAAANPTDYAAAARLEGLPTPDSLPPVAPQTAAAALASGGILWTYPPPYTDTPVPPAAATGAGYGGDGEGGECGTGGNGLFIASIDAAYPGQWPAGYPHRLGVFTAAGELVAVVATALPYRPFDSVADKAPVEADLCCYGPDGCPWVGKYLPADPGFTPERVTLKRNPNPASVSRLPLWYLFQQPPNNGRLYRTGKSARNNIHIWVVRDRMPNAKDARAAVNAPWPSR